MAVWFTPTRGNESSRFAWSYLEDENLSGKLLARAAANSRCKAGTKSKVRAPSLVGNLLTTASPAQAAGTPRARPQGIPTLQLSNLRIRAILSFTHGNTPN